jgi:predicted O-methyltransferase YrrM
MNILENIITQTLTGNGSSDQNAATLFAVALSSKGKRFLELGVENGASTLPLLEATRRNEGMLTSIDIEATSFAPPDELKPYWRFIKSDALAYLRSLPKDLVFDVVYIDDLHTYPQVKEELQLLKNHVTPMSVILLHDLMWPRCQPRYHTISGKQEDDSIWMANFSYGGPYRAVAELDDQWEWATLPWRNGLTVLRKKAPLWKETYMSRWFKKWLRNASPRKWKFIHAVYGAWRSR